MSESESSSKQMDMLHGSLLKKILLFALPLACGSILQQLFNSMDVAVIGWFEDSNAQAAVNSNSSFVNLLIDLFGGSSVGVTVVIAAYIGKRQTEDIHSVVLTSFVIALVGGVLLVVVGTSISEPILKLLNTPSEILPLATQYLKIYFFGMPVLMLYNFGAAMLRSIGDTRRPLYILIVTGILNIGLNVLFVGVFKMSVAGVAWATFIANAVSAAAVLFFIMKDETLRIRWGQSKIRAKYLKHIFRIGIPSGLQGMLFALSNMSVQSAINSFGGKAMAGSGDAVYFECYVHYFTNAFMQAAVTFSGQNYAAKEYDRCKRIFCLSLCSGLVVSALLSLTFNLGGDLFIRIYTSEEEVIEYALIRFRYVLLFGMLTTFFEIPGGLLRGIGYSLLPTVITLVGSCGLRIVWIYTVFRLYPNSFKLLMLVYPISWVVTGAAMLIAYALITRRKLKKSS